MTTCNPNFQWPGGSGPCGPINPWEPTDGGPTQTATPPVFRTSPQAVQGILKGVDTSFDLTPMIAVANSLVTEVCVNPPYCPNFPYAPGRLELIERWLAAHVYTIYRRRELWKKLGRGEAKYNERKETGLQASEYGQMAMILDSNGSLARIDRHARNGVRGLVIFMGNRRYGGYWPWSGAGDAPYGLGDIG